MRTYLAKALVATVLSCLVLSSVLAQTPKVVASSSSQPSDGITQADMDQAFLLRYQEYVKELLLTKLRLRIEAMGKRLPANFDVPADSLYITVGSMKLAATQFNVSGVSNSVEVLGIVGNTMYRVGCVHLAKDKVPLSYGPCADKLKEVFGVDLNNGFRAEHLRTPEDS